LVIHFTRPILATPNFYPRDVVNAGYNATATWLAGLVAGCLSQPVLCLND